MLPTIGVPTTVVHRQGDVIIPVGNARYLAEHIAGARYVELPGDDHLWFVGDRDAILDPMLELLDAEPPAPEHVLATILSVRTPPEGSVPALVARHGGRLLGPGLAAFDGPSRAVRCAEALRSFGAGVHIGECERRGERLDGPVVELAMRLGGPAAPGQVLVSRTVVDLVAGSGLSFEKSATPVDGPGGPIEVSALK